MGVARRIPLLETVRSNERSKLTTAGIFIAGGGLTAAIYYALLAVLLGKARLEYHLAITVAYLTAITFQFLINRIVTFRAAGAPVFPQAARYLATAGINYLATLAVATVAVELIGLNAYWGALLALLVTTPLNFILSKKWVFVRGIR
jgi:putative flippase GtrA